MKIYSSEDKKWMQRALSLAALGRGFTSPNPLVGAVIINRYGELISEGFHYKAGTQHAEAMAFQNLTKDPTGGAIYVNLEPCCHYGRTPPCVNKIIDSGIRKVFIAIKDPDMRVSGKGIELLNKNGIDIDLGLFESEAIELNKEFIHRVTTGNSYGVLKWAMSIDGRISLKNGDSKWITNTKSRSKVHSLRAVFDAVVIGGNTLRKDNPLLTSRGRKSPEPLRVVFTKSLDLPQNSQLWDCDVAKTIVVYDSSTANEKYLQRIPSCVEIHKLGSDNPQGLSKILAEKGCNKILWECGPELATSAMRRGCIQEVITFISPKILGGIKSMTPFSDFDFKKVDDSIILQRSRISSYDGDLCSHFLIK